MRKLPLLIILFFAAIQVGKACSGYKITQGAKTILGSNEDAWRLTPHIWFENASDTSQYGAAFTGSRHDGENGYAPQAGMNVRGLSFERLVSYHPRQAGFANRKAITNPTKYLKDILHTCETVEEVQAYISQYDHSYFMEDVFLYADKSGKYLIVEPYSLTLGNEPSHVISNFCPSITPAQDANRLERYRHGQAFLKNKLDTTLEFLTALSDTMHVCRKKIGDGTLLTSIWDLSNARVNLFFYHDFQHTVQFDLHEELKKGDHIIAIETLFPPNSEFEQLRRYKTPKNSTWMGVLIVASGGFSFLHAVFFLLQFIRKRKFVKYAILQLLLFPLGLIVCYYMYVLSGPINVFYFPAPYKDPGSVLVSLSSYVPFLLLFLIIPFGILNLRLMKGTTWNAWAKGFFTLNTLVYLILMALFVYWGFYEIIHV